MSCIPFSYRPARWRNTLPMDPATGCIGIGFNRDNGHVLRLSLDLTSARSLQQTLADALKAHDLRVSGSHSRISSGIPSSDVSTGCPLKKQE